MIFEKITVDESIINAFKSIARYAHIVCIGSGNDSDIASISKDDFLGEIPETHITIYTDIASCLADPLMSPQMHPYLKYPTNIANLLIRGIIFLPKSLSDYNYIIFILKSDDTLQIFGLNALSSKIPTNNRSLKVNSDFFTEMSANKPYSFKNLAKIEKDGDRVYSIQIDGDNTYACCSEAVVTKNPYGDKEIYASKLQFVDHDGSGIKVFPIESGNYVYSYISESYRTDGSTISYNGGSV